LSAFFHPAINGPEFPQVQQPKKALGAFSELGLTGEMLDMKNRFLLLPRKTLANTFDHVAALLTYFLLVGHTVYAEGSGHVKTNSTPVASQSCGAVALSQLAHVLQSGTKVEERILNTPAPKNGFSLAELQGLAATNGMKLEAVRPSNGGEIPVPSIVHWKVGHYGVLVAKRGLSYRVIDERSGGGVWVDSRTMQIYGSGVFLAPEGAVQSDWHQLSQAEAEALRGGIPCYGWVQYGYCYYGDLPDDEDPPQDCCDDNDDQDADCDPPSANDGASDGGDNPPPPPCCCDMGMPKWYVSAYVNLWLVDRPLLYKTSNDKWFPLKLTYNSRGPSHGTNSFGFGPKWECNWIAMVQSSSTNYPQMSNFRAAGGLVPVNGNCTGTGNSTACQVYRSAQAIAVSPTGTIMTSARGGLNHYGFSFLAGLGLTNIYMDQRIDRYGRAVQYGYLVESGVAHLKTVQDTDGRTSTLTYTGDLISSVSDPYGHTAHFYYVNGMLSQITDAASMSSFFYYDTNGFITNMVTPYGTTSFEYFSNPTNNPRALLVTEANGEHQLYSFVPSSVAPSTYHWNRAQYNAISDDGKANYLNMPPEDYDKGDVQQLLFYARTDEDPPVISDTVALSAPAVDPQTLSRPGTLMFTYQGQTNAAYTGTLKKVTSISRDGTLQVGIGRNDLGRPVTVTNFYSDGTTVATIYSNTFDASGRYLQKQLGPQSELTRGYGYHPVITNLLVSLTNAVGDVTRYTHDTNTMKVTSITFPTGLIRTNEYTGGFRTKQTDEGVRTNSFTYTSGNVSGQTDELGLATTRSYDELNRLRQINFSDGSSISNYYDKLDLVGVKDRLGLWTRYTYNNVRQLIGETNANGAVTTYQYCSCGSPSSITRWNGSTPLTDTFGYDMLGRLTNATYADGYQLNYLYWGPGIGNGLLEAVTDSSGLTLALNYVQIGEKFKISSAVLAGQQIVANQYDQYGRLLTTLDRNGITVSNSYDLVDRLITRITLDQGSTPYATNSYVYTAQGLTNTVDALNHTNWFVRDVVGRLLFQTNANNELLQFTYNPADEIQSLVDGKNQTTHWNYDEFGRVTNKVDQANAVILRYTYDPDSRLTNRWSSAKGNTKYKYDSVGNLTNIDYPISVDVSYAYDSLNRLTNMIDAIGTTTFTYTDSGQLVTENGPFASSTLASIYWSRMRTNLSLAQPSGVWNNAFGYDFANRLNSVMSPAGTFSYNYEEPSARLTSLSLPNGTYVNNQYDTMSRLTYSFLFNSVGTPLDGHTYEYDQENQRTNEVRADSSTVAYSYDNIGQLVVANSSVNTENRGYLYDGAWNLNRRTNNGVLLTFIVDNKNQLTNAPSPVGTGIYDANGNLATNHSGGWTYTYDDENRLTQLFRQAVGLHDSDQSTTFAYDGLSRLRMRMEYTWVATNNIQQSRPSQPNTGGGSSGGYWRLDSETHYIYDGSRVIQERDGNNTPTVSYTRGNDLGVSLQGAGGIGGLLARSSGYSSGDGSWSSHADYYADGNGNVTSLIDANQNVVASYRYDPFGNIISKSGSLSDANVYRFSSKEVHVKSGLYYYGFRFYDPNSQRWITRDPLEEWPDCNMYRFNYSNPINFVDQNGLWGIQFGGFNIGWGAPNYVFDGGTDWGGYWGDVGDTAIGEAKGAGAELSFGLYKPCYTSNLQRQGGYVGTGLAMAGETLAGWGAAGKAVRGATEYSHWIPARAMPGGRGSLLDKVTRAARLNGNNVSRAEHALSDPWRHRFMPRAWKQANPLPNVVSQQLNRVPRFPLGMATAAAGGYASSQGDGGCQ
jgi:RHS repeat-associated protein